MEHTLARQHTSILPGLEHPSFPGRTIPAVLDGYEPPDWCVHCAWLAQMIRAGRYVEQYGLLAIEHVAAAHPSYGIHNIGDGDVRETRQTYNCGGAS